MYRAPRNKADILSGVDKPVKKSRVLARSTVGIQYEDGTEAIRYHDTDVVTFDGDLVKLDSGGFRTSTTKSRINEHTDLSVSQDKGIWYVCKQGDWDNKEHFYDGITFDKEGNLVSESRTPDLERIKAIKKKVNRFLKLLDNGIPMPSAGDCFLCMAGQKSCLKDHIREGYLHGTLILRALEAKGYNNPAFIMQMGLKDQIKRALRAYILKELLPDVAHQ